MRPNSNVRPPRVSVIIPAYNAAPYIAEALASVLAQTYQDFEIMVSDDGSKDDTAERVKPFLQDPRVRYAWGTNGGVSCARNRGIKLARGEFVAFLDADDWWPKQKLEKQVALMDAHPEIGLLCGDTAQFDEEGIWCQSWFREQGLRPAFLGESLVVTDVFAKLLEVTFIPTGTVLVRRSVMDTVGLFDESLPVAEDLDFFLRVARFCPIGCSPETWLYKRCHSANLTSDHALIYRYDVRVRERMLEVLPRSSHEYALVRRSLAQALFRAGYNEWMQDRFPPAARAFVRSLAVRFSARTLMYALASSLGEKTVRHLRVIRRLTRLTPARLPSSRLPGWRKAG